MGVELKVELILNVPFCGHFDEIFILTVLFCGHFDEFA